MQSLRWMALAAVGCFALTACSSSSNSAKKDGPAVIKDAMAQDGSVPDAAVYDLLASHDLPLPLDGPPVCLGTKYPGIGSIDPDNPDYEDALYSKAEVIAKFAAAKAADAPAYRAYKAALAYSAELECAFCDCGCAPLEGHKSASDCFKDMHGFG